MSSTSAHLERIARGGTLSVAGAGVAAAGNFAVVAVITNGYSQSEAGILFSASSLFLVLLSVIGLGIEVGLGRFVMRFLVDGRGGAIRACLRNTALVTVVTSLAIGVALFAGAPVAANLLGLGTAEAVTAIRVLAAMVPFAAIANWAMGASRAFANIRQTVMIDKLFRTLLQLALVLGCVALGRGLVELTWAWVLPAGLAAPLAVIGLRSIARRRLPPADHPEEVAGVVGEFWRFTWPRSIAQVSQMVIQRADIIIIAALISPAAAAVYTAATRFVPLGQIGVQAVQQVIQPRFTELLATGDTVTLRDVFKVTTSWNITLAWPIYLVVGSLPPLYLALFGQGFADDGMLVVVVMAVAMMIGVGSGPVDTMLLMSGKSSLSLVNSLTALVIDISLCFALIPSIGILGAAVAWCAAVTVRAVLGYLQVRHALGLSPLSGAAGLAALAALVCFGVPLATLSLTGHATLGAAGITGSLGLCAYAGALWLLRRPLRLGALRALVPRRRKR